MEKEKKSSERINKRKKNLNCVVDPTGEKQNATPRILGWRGRTGGWELPGMSVVVEAEGLSAARAPRGVYSLVAPQPTPKERHPPWGRRCCASLGGPGRGGGMSQGRARGKPTSSEAAERGARKKPSLAVCLRCKITIKLTVKIFQTQEGSGKGAQMDSKCPLQARGCRTVGGEWIKVLLGAVKLEVSPPRQHEAWEEQGSAERLQNRTQSTAQRLGASRKGRGTERAPRAPHRVGRPGATKGAAAPCTLSRPQKRHRQRGADPATPCTQLGPAAGLRSPPRPPTQSALLLAVFYPRKNKSLPPFPSHAGGEMGVGGGGIGGGRPR